MSDYIKREDAIDAICGSGCPCKGEEECVNKDCVVYNILKVPSADVVERPLYERSLSDVVRLSVERKKGKWIWDDEGYHCSECWFHAHGNTLECMDGTYRFCLNCGAEMVGDA